MSDELGLGSKIVIGVIASLILSGVGFFIYQGQEAWHDTGSVTWIQVGQKQFADPLNQGIWFWYTPFSYSITTGSHGSINFTDQYNHNQCSYCHTSPIGKPAYNQTVGIVKHNNGSFDIYLDP